MIRKTLVYASIVMIVIIAAAREIYAKDTDTGALIIHHADELVYDGKKHNVECKGSVDIQNGKYNIKAEYLSLQLNDLENELLSAVAEGNVIITGENIEGYGRTAVYSKKKQTVVLRGSATNPARVKKGLNWLKGKEFIYDIENKRITSHNIRGVLNKEKTK